MRGRSTTGRWTNKRRTKDGASHTGR